MPVKQNAHGISQLQLARGTFSQWMCGAKARWVWQRTSPSHRPWGLLAPLTSFTLFVHTAPLCANIANPFQIGCAIVQNFFAGLRPTPRQGSRPGPQKGNYCDNILLPGRVGNYWTNIFDKFRDPYPLPASLTPCSCTWCVREDIITGRKDRVA